MAISNTRQFVLLLWKNWLLQKRQIALTFFQVLLPPLFSLILLIIRTKVESKFISTPTVWNSTQADTALPPNLLIPVQIPSPARYWQLAYAPNDTQASLRLVNEAAKLLNNETIRNPLLNGVIIGAGFKTEDDLLNFFTDQTASYTTLCGLVFSADSFDGNGNLRRNAKITYKIRLRAEGYNGTYGASSFSSSSSNWQTNRNYAFQLSPGPQGDMYGGKKPGYYYEGFLAIQRAVDMSIMDELSGGLVSSSGAANNVDVQLKSFPYPPYLDDIFLFILTVQFPFIIMLSFIVIAPTICKDVVLEKEKKLKESMKLMGMKAWLHWMSWFFKYAVFMLISVSLMTLFFHVKVSGRAIINYTHWSITFVFLLLYTLSLITFCFAISTFFSKASAGAAAGGIIYLASYVPFFFIGSISTYPTLSASTKAGCSIVSNLAMGIGCWTLASFESIGTGVQWSTINETVNAEANFTMLYTYLLLILDIFIYSVITWYFDALFPGDFGTPQPFYFPFTKWYWCGRKANAVDFDRDITGGKVDYGENDRFFEAAPPNARVGIKVRNLTKKFNKIQRPAVNKLNVDMYEGQITALLGHNGAGKTTTMFMLTGFLPQTSGTAYINGYDLTTDLANIRQNLGLCPQHDVLFDTLTVHEHLTFFAELKGCSRSDVTAEVNNMIKVLHLEDKRDVASSKLSGGMKRKLSVGIALIAGSKFVILDEPTSGMDPEARRQAWDILQSQRAGRTMILSTHFMDEADLLGDRIAIMADGQLQCYGSSLFLKGIYGIGYHLTVVKSPSCNVDRVQERIKSYVNDAQMESNVGAELSFILPKEKSNQFESLFTDLEQNRLELGIDSFGASVTTLEEVFIKVGEMCDSGLQSNLQNGNENGDDDSKLLVPAGGGIRESSSTKSLSVSMPPSYVSSNNSIIHVGSNEEGRSRDNELFGVFFRRVSGPRRYLKQFRALIVKHAIHSLRNIVLTIVQIALPVIFTILACVVEKTIVPPTDPPALPLNMSYFTKQVILSASGPGLSASANSLQTSYRNVAGAWGQVNITTDPDVDRLLISVASDNLDSFNRYYTIADTVNDSITGTAVLTSHYNNIALHAIAISLSVTDNAIMQYLGTQLGSASNIGTGSYIETINHPLPRSLSTQTNDAASTASTSAFTFSYLLSFGMAFLVATFVVFVVSERVTKAKQSQFIAGIGSTNFWISTFAWDALCFLIPSALVIVVVAAFQTGGYSDKDIIGLLFFDLVMYGWSVIPFAYLISFLFQVASSAYTWVLVINIFTGTVAVLAIFILQIPSLGIEEIGNGLEWFFYVFLPNFCFNKALQDLYTNYQYGTICDKIDETVNRTTFCQYIETSNASNLCCPNACGSQCTLTNDNYISWEAPGIGRSLVFMGIQGLVFFLILFFLESNTIRRVFQVCGARESTVPLAVSIGADGSQQVVQLTDIGSPNQILEDDDVRSERERISRTPDSELIRSNKIVLRELTKFYNGSFLAVDRLSVGIPDGECFGLLGVNGAGKTTTFKMMIGDESVSAGDATLEGFSVQRNGQEARERVGYCPQFDALIDQMTVTETLWMYARMRGVVESDIKNLVEKMIEQLTLRKHAVKQAKNLSGGNRRKLSTGIALIGNPSIVFLDEPTTGMDPVARRLLWNTLAAIRSSGRTLILTSHSMEECEALCTRLAIMVNGRFQCLGSPQRLKAKFGEGYSLIIKIRQGANTVSASTTENESRLDRRPSSVLQGGSRNRVGSISTGENAQDDLKTKRVMDFVKQQFPGSQLKDQHDGLLHYRVIPDSGSSTPDSGLSMDGNSSETETIKRPIQQLSWSYVFGQIERAKVELDIEDYSVSQTTLEQIFISFARMQRPTQEVEQKGCCGWGCSCSCCSCCKKKKKSE